jgi:serine/threonine protein kinase
MIALLKDWFGAKQSGGARPRRARVNLQRRFTLVSMTSQGSMSRVHRAVDNTTGATVCLKVQIPDKNAAAAARAEARPCEGEIASKVAHPNVVKVFEYGESTQGEHFLVMEYIDGVSLKFIRETGAADLKEKLELLVQAADGLAAVHEAGLIHRDIGPMNYLVDRNQRVKLIDFGLAVPNTPAFRRPGNRTGTIQYMAPELVRREPTDERLDIFSFGAMAFEFLTGKLPYDSKSTNSMTLMLQRINQEPLDPSQANAGLPAELNALIRKLIARHKEDRCSSMAIVAKALRKIRV